MVQVAAGGGADGSELVIFDLLGFLPPESMAKRSKAYAGVAGETVRGYMTFDHEVKDGVYPQEEHGWHMDEAELEKFQDMLDKE